MFRGVVNDAGMRINRGSVCIYKNGDYFVGHQVKDDFGTYFNRDNSYHYEGDWINCKPHGLGK